MNKLSRLRKIIAPLALGIGVVLGTSAPVISHPHYSNSHRNYHRSTFRNVRPFRSLNVTPRNYIPLPYSGDRYYKRDRYDRHDRYYRDYDRHDRRERRVHRRGFRPDDRDRRYDRDGDRYIRIYYK